MQERRLKISKQISTPDKVNELEDTNLPQPKLKTNSSMHVHETAQKKATPAQKDKTEGRKKRDRHNKAKESLKSPEKSSQGKASVQNSNRKKNERGQLQEKLALAQQSQEQASELADLALLDSFRMSQQSDLLHEVRL